MGVPTIKTGPMTVEEFYAFTDKRPDNEKWELIDGEPILNASPSHLHQIILKNLIVILSAIERREPQSWEAIPGVGVRVSETSLPEPDVLIVPAGAIQQQPLSRQTHSAVATFEILSPSTEQRDLQWKRAAYSGLASLRYYVVIAQDAAEVVVFAREESFRERRFRSVAATIELPSLAIILPLSEIYRDTGLA